MDLADVDKLMAGDLGQWLEDQTMLRDSVRRKTWLYFGFGLIMACLLIALMWLIPIEWTFEGGEETRIGLTVLVVMLAFTLPFRFSGPAKHKIKVGINSAIASQLGLQYSAQVPPGSKGRGKGWEPARLYGLVPSYNKSSFQDCWSGELAGHDFKLFEASLHYQQGTGTNSTYKHRFSGAIVQIAFGRPFRSTTILHRKGDKRAFEGLFGRAETVTKGGEHLDYVKNVHPLFEDTFDLYSDDQVEARTLIHPAYIEQLLEIERAFFGSNVRALFHDGLVVIAVESGNLFESGGMDASKDRERVERTAQQFAALARLALAFNQTERGRTVASPGG